MPADTTSAKPEIAVYVPAGRAPGLLLAPRSYLGEGGLWPRYMAAVGALRFVKEDGGRKGQHGSVELAARAVAKLQADGFAVVAADQEAADRLAEGARQAGGAATDAEAHLQRRVIELAARGLVPRDYQLVGIRWLRATRAGALLDDMGLGKTMQVLLAMGDRALVFCPATAKGVWARECAMWRPDLTAKVLEGKGSIRWPQAGELVIVNYDVVGESDVEEIGPAPAGMDMAVDEGHVVKNARTNRAKAVKAAAVAVERAEGRRWIVTATPICNRPMELKAVLDAVGAFGLAFTSYAAFSRAFGGAVRSPKAEPTADAGPALARVSLRRLKSEVAKDLPSKTVVRVPVQVSGRVLELAAQIEEKLRPVVEGAEFAAAAASAALGEDAEKAAQRRAEAMEKALGEAADIGEMSKFRRLVDEAMIPHAIEMIESLEDADEPVVVASCYRGVCDAMAKREGWFTITGDDSAAEKTDTCDRFQRGEGKGVALTIRAGGVGVTLTRAATMIMTSRDWNPSMTEQCQDRIHRIEKQCTRPVTIYHLHAGTWIEQKVDELTLHKSRMIAGALAGVTSEGGQLPVAPVLADVAVGLAPQAAGANLPRGWTADADLVARVRKLGDDPHAPGVVTFLLKVLGERGGLPGNVKGQAIAAVVADAEGKAAKAAARAAKAGVPATAKAPSQRSETPRLAANDQERFAACAICQLQESNPDGTRDQNDVGPNRMDAARVAKLAAAIECDGMLTDDEWAWCVRKAVFYRRQVGPMPQAAAVQAAVELACDGRFQDAAGALAEVPSDEIPF